MNEDKLLKEAYKLRFEFYNVYMHKEDKWHKKYVNHYMYDILVESFKYKFSEIAIIMPKLLEKIK